MVKISFLLSVLLLTLVDFSYAQRDPFKLLTLKDLDKTYVNTEEPVLKSGKLRLVGVVWDEFKPTALVEFSQKQRVLHTHDIINNYKVIDIQKNMVILEKNKKKIELKLGQTQ